VIVDVSLLKLATVTTPTTPRPTHVFAAISPIHLKPVLASGTACISTAVSPICLKSASIPQAACISMAVYFRISKNQT